MTSLVGYLIKISLKSNMVITIFFDSRCNVIPFSKGFEHR